MMLNKYNSEQNCEEVCGERKGGDGMNKFKIQDLTPNFCRYKDESVRER